MAELFFMATIVFVAYVVFVALDGKKDTHEPDKTEAVKQKAVEPEIQQPEKIAPPAATVKSAAKPKPARAKPASAKPAAKAAPAPVAEPEPTPAPAPTVAVDSLKNPKTGEVAKVPNSYSFAKRWIKDALVEEGLLDKVYKNNELDDAAMAKIQDALQQLKAMAKYQ